MKPLLAETHVPHRAWDLPEQLWRAVGEADVGGWRTCRRLDRRVGGAGSLVSRLVSTPTMDNAPGGLEMPVHCTLTIRHQE